MLGYARENGMAEYHTHKWEPISDLPWDWETSLANPSVVSLVSAWQEQAHELRPKDLFRNFLERIKQPWALPSGLTSA